MSEITAFACGFNVRDWAYCDGSIQQIGQNPSLFDLIGTTFGGNGTTEFQLPDLRSRSIVGTGQGGGLTAIPLGGTGGAENVTLSVANLAAHDHTATFTPTGGSTTGTFIVKSGGGPLHPYQ